MFQVKMLAVLLLLSISVLSALALAQQPATQAAAPQADKEAQAAFDVLLNAIQANDFAAFAAAGDTAFKAALTKEVFEQVCTQMAPRMKQGYETTFLGELKQQGYKVFLWKMTFKDEGDDFLLKLVMKDGKVSGFFLV